MADDIRVVVTVDATDFMSQARRALFGIYQLSQVWGLPDRYHFGIRAREVGNE